MCRLNAIQFGVDSRISVWEAFEVESRQEVESVNVVQQVATLLDVAHLPHAFETDCIITIKQRVELEGKTIRGTLFCWSQVAALSTLKSTPLGLQLNL